MVTAVVKPPQPTFDAMATAAKPLDLSGPRAGGAKRSSQRSRGARRTEGADTMKEE